jgi:predicted ATPase
MHVKGYAAPETKAAVERARLLEKAEAIGERPEDPLTLFSTLYSLMSANVVAFNGDLVREQAAQFLMLAEKEKTTAALLMAHRFMGLSLLYTGDSVAGLRHVEQAIAAYDRAEHRSLAVRFGQDAGVHAQSYRAFALWLLGYPEAALAQCAQAISDAREIGHAPTLMNTLTLTTYPHLLCGSLVTASAQIDELGNLAEDRRLVYWQAMAIWVQGWLLSIAGDATKAVRALTSGISAWQSTGGTLFAPTQLCCLAVTYAKLGQFDDARRTIGEAVTATQASKETWFEAEVYRVAGEITLLSPERDAAKAEACFQRSLAVAREQQAKSWELRASTSLARLWRDQGKMQEARELLAPVYEWFTEGFDTRDLKDARALLDELVS